jgi:hypothetical protein
MKLKTIFIFNSSSLHDVGSSRTTSSRTTSSRTTSSRTTSSRTTSSRTAAVDQPRALRPRALAAALLLALAASPAHADPQITLPPDEPAPAIPRPQAFHLQRETQIEVPLDQSPTTSTAIGGYGELTVNAPSNGPAVVDLRRLVIFIGHNFTPKLRFYGELEMEHAVTSASDKGEFEVEQAFLDYLAWRPFNLRAGVIILPVGIINVYHEPPTFNGVDRPDTDTYIIPTTWREAGAGVFGEWRSLRYQLYAVNGFNATGFSATYGLRDGHQEAQLALGHDWGIVARLDYPMPFLYRYGIGGDLGLSFYFADADQGQAIFKGSEGDTVPVTLVEADVRLRSRGLELRAELASVFIGGIHRLNRGLTELAMMQTPPAIFDGPVASQLLGGYVELGYNVLHRLNLRSGMQLVPFARYEHSDTQYVIPDGYARAPGNRRDTLTAGLTFRPIAEVALKLDYQRIYTDAARAADATVDKFDAGLAFMF